MYFNNAGDMPSVSMSFPVVPEYSVECYFNAVNKAY